MVIEDNPTLTEDVKIFLFESVRELLFNVIKHAKISCVSVKLETKNDTEICITVSDEGAGFDVCGINLAGYNYAGFGLFSINERIGLIGGRMEIDSSVGKGSCFSLVVPNVSRVVERV